MGITHQVYAMKLNENEPLMKRRKHINAVETEGLLAFGIKSESDLECWSDGCRRKGGRSMV